MVYVSLLNITYPLQSLKTGLLDRHFFDASLLETS
uniref:Uncharacterized protein n=1 Tax=Anguilla anguilla TaxID=7936 RepID=A0A0E9QFY7_ANGAN